MRPKRRRPASPFAGNVQRDLDARVFRGSVVVVLGKFAWSRARSAARAHSDFHHKSLSDAKARGGREDAEARLQGLTPRAPERPGGKPWAILEEARRDAKQLRRENSAEAAQGRMPTPCGDDRGREAEYAELETRHAPSSSIRGEAVDPFDLNRAKLLQRNLSKEDNERLHYRSRPKSSKSH